MKKIGVVIGCFVLGWITLLISLLLVSALSDSALVWFIAIPMCYLFGRGVATTIGYGYKQWGRYKYYSHDDE